MQGIDDFFHELDLGVDVHEACSNAFFRLGRDSTWSRGQIAVFAPDYLFWVRSFPSILAGLVANVRDEESRLFLTEILYSELGSGTPETMHFKLFQDFLLSLGVGEEDIKSAPRYEETTSLVGGMRTLYSHRDVLIALGAQYALEKQAFPMIEQLYAGFKRCSAGGAPRFEYFDLHLVEEPKHLECMRRCVLRHLCTVEDKSRVAQGANECLDLIGGFWRRQFIEVSKLQESQDG